MEDSNIEVFIFGASVGGKNVYDIFCNLGIKVVGFVDNNKDKWGILFQGIKIYNPNILLNCTRNQKIVIASTYYDEIKIQLLKMNIKEDKIIKKEQLIVEVLKLQKGYLGKYVNCNENIIFDLSEGFILSGVVNWSINLIEELYENKKNIFVLSMKKKDCNYDYSKIKENIYWTDYSFTNYKESIEKTFQYMKSKLPCKIIINQISQVFFAACMLKQQYKDKVQIISVIHSDFSRIYEQNVFLDDYIDQYICVSSNIIKKLTQYYKIDKTKLYYRPTSIEYHKNQSKIYSKVNMPINIAYAARLEKAQKRTDLLIPLIEMLNNMDIQYILNIAGDGSYYKKLESYIYEHNLENKVNLYGSITYDSMKMFWNANDIFINLSDIEGMPIALLEAMSWGVVPVVTRTSGVCDIINNGINGYICEIGAIEDIAKKIQLLYQNRELISQIGNKCRNYIEKNHNRNQYMRFLLEI